MARYPARYYDGLTARVRLVEVEVAATGIAIFDEAGPFLASWPGESIRLVEGLRRGEPVRLGLAGAMARLVVNDSGIVEALGKTAPHLGSRQKISRRAVARTALWAALAAASLAGLVFVVVPLLATQFAAATPDAVKYRIGREVLTQLAALLPGPSADADGRYCSQADGLAALKRLNGRIAAGQPALAAARAIVIDSPLVNAFALPGGITVLTGGLIREAQSAEEIAGVLAHEHGHIAHDDPTRGLYRSFGFSLLVGVLLGDLTGGTLTGGLAEWLLNSGYTREAERAADRFALARLEAAGIDSRGLAAFFARLAEKEQDGPLIRILSTHPASAERLAHIRAAGTRAVGPAMTEEDWQDLRRICLTLQTEPALPRRRK